MGRNPVPGDRHSSGESQGCFLAGCDSFGAVAGSGHTMFMFSPVFMLSAPVCAAFVMLVIVGERICARQENKE